MKILSAVVVFLLLAVTAGGIVGYFEYNLLVSGVTQVLVQQQAQIDHQEKVIQGLQKDIDRQDKNTAIVQKEVGELAKVLTEIIESAQTPDKPSRYDNSSMLKN